jgi:hypothetical protein
MVFNWLFGRSHRDEPDDAPPPRGQPEARRRAPQMPYFYPGLGGKQLAQFLSDQEYRRIRTFESVYILPLVSSVGAPEQLRFGQALSKLLIRNLMLLRDVSIHGPEDTPPLVHELAGKHLTGRGSAHVTGIAGFGDNGYSLRFDVVRPGRARESGRARHKDLGTFLRDCSATVGRALGSRLETTVPDAWEVGQPRDVGSLLRLGGLILRFASKGDVRDRSRGARELLAADVDFAVPAWEVDDESPGARDVYLEALEHDPYNAQLCFLAFCAVWRSQGPQPDALQFCRRAIELSPGHGKAHMCAPHAAVPDADMLRHSELGYRLLPTNPFAINNYILYLRRRGVSGEQLLELAEEGIAADPYDPGCYLQMIDLFCKNGEYRAALQLAQRLQRLFEPMNERALYCLKQNPARARQIESGQYNPAAENRRRIAELRKLVREEDKVDRDDDY